MEISLEQLIATIGLAGSAATGVGMWMRSVERRIDSLRRAQHDSRKVEAKLDRILEILSERRLQIFREVDRRVQERYKGEEGC